VSELVLGRRWATPAWVFAALVACAIAGFAAAYAPFIALGVIFGIMLLFASVLYPLAVTGVMLVLGPLDLSFITGGFKGLFPSLGGLDMNGIRLIGVVIGLSAVALVERDVLRHAVGRYGRWYLLFLVYAAGTIVYSRSPIEGMRLLLKLTYPFLVFVVILGVTRTKADLERLVDWVLFGSAVLAVIIAPMFILAGQYIVDEENRVRIAGIGLHENPMSFYLLLMLLLAYARFSVRGKLYYLLLCVPFVLWMVLARTRITFAAVFAGLVGAMIYGALVNRNYRTIIGTAVLGTLVFVPLAPLVFERSLGYVPSIPEFLGLLASPLYLFHMINWEGREIFWAVIAKAFSTSPIYGLGLGSSTAVLIATFPKEFGTVPHNEYLRLLCDTGVVGTVLFFIAVAHWWGGALSAGRSMDKLVREFALPATAGILAWAVISITDNPLDYYNSFTQYIGFLCAGALVAAQMTTDALPAVESVPLEEVEVVARGDWRTGGIRRLP
jgi:O-antigen ligase